MTAKVVPIKPDHVPTGLSPEARALWCELSDDFSITDSAGRVLLLLVCESFDRMRESQAAIATDGLTSRGSKKQMRAHPLLAVEDAARKQMLAALKMLNLDVEPLNRLGRPPGGRGA